MANKAVTFETAIPPDRGLSKPEGLRVRPGEPPEALSDDQASKLLIAAVSLS
jgi:hypothetical protein